MPEFEKTKTSQIMKVFMDTANEYPDVKVVAIGAVLSKRVPFGSRFLCRAAVCAMSMAHGRSPRCNSGNCRFYVA